MADASTTWPADLGQPKWQAVLDDLQRQFDRGDYQPGDLFPTLEAVCQEYQVSNITARRVFRELKQRGLILPQGRRGTFVTQQAARQTIYMCIRPGHLPTQLGGMAYDSVFFRTFMSLFHREGYDRRFEVKPISVDFCLRNLPVIGKHPLLVAMDAVVKASGEHVLIDQQRLDTLCQACNVVAFRFLPGVLRDPVDQIVTDHGHGMTQAIDHLAQRGHRHIAMLSGRPTNIWFSGRHGAFAPSLRQAGLPLHQGMIEITSGNHMQEDFAALDRLLARSPRPTAVICTNDGRALHVLEYCRARGLSVPGDLAVTGFDNTMEASLAQPGLTSVDCDNAAVIRHLFQFVQRRLAKVDVKPVMTTVRPRLVVRHTT